MSKRGSYIGGHTIIKIKEKKKLSLKKKIKPSLIGYKKLVDQDKTKIVSHFRAVIERNEIRIKKQIKKNKNHQLIEKLSRENQRLKDKIYEFNS
tara:strand:+ start:30 stop:311 length:282 start_codon:yes stop_codon:yes gene_type:complete